MVAKNITQIRRIMKTKKVSKKKTLLPSDQIYAAAHLASGVIWDLNERISRELNAEETKLFMLANHSYLLSELCEIGSCVMSIINNIEHLQNFKSVLICREEESRSKNK